MIMSKVISDKLGDGYLLYSTSFHYCNAYMPDSLIYSNLLAMLLFCLDALVVCELASTFNVLTWRVMPDLQAMLCLRRTTFPAFAS